VLTATDPAAALADLQATIEEASWAIAPSGPGAAQLATLIGFPVAVVRAQLLLELAGNPATSQLWAATGQDDDGGITQASFPVQLGSSALDDDGLVGYFRDSDPVQLSSPYGPSASGYIAASPVTVTVGQTVALTMLMHPQGLVHAFTGLLPPISAALPAAFQAAPMSAMEVTFRSGPLLSPPTAITVPIPAFGGGDWAWLQYDATPDPAQPRPLSPANASAQLIDVPPTLRDGWLRLTLAVQPSRLTYAVTPTALPGGAAGIQGATSLTITAYNSTGVAVACTSIGITLPVGGSPNALTGNPGLIQPVSGQPETWNFQVPASGQPGTFLATPATPVTSVTSADAVGVGQTLTFALTGIEVSPGPGLALIQIDESADDAQATVTLAVEIFSLPPA
jgi:hypothetical protein